MMMVMTLVMTMMIVIIMYSTDVPHGTVHSMYNDGLRDSSLAVALRASVYEEVSDPWF